MSLYGSYDNYKKETAGGSSNEPTGGYAEWKKKKKKPVWVDPVKVAEQRRIEEQRQQAPPISKPVDQVEHEKNWNEMSLFEKTKATGKEFVSQTLGDKGLLGIAKATVSPINEYLNKNAPTPYTPTTSVTKNLVGEIGTRVEDFSSDVLTGLSGGQIKAPKIGEDKTVVDKALSVLGNAVGAVATLGAGDTLLGSPAMFNKAETTFTAGSGILDNIPMASEIATKYPNFAKYAIPMAKSITTFTGYGQLDPRLADDYNARLKKAGVDAVTAVPYTLLGFVKDFRKSVPLSFTLGYGMAKLDGASNKDALVAGSTLGLLDLYGRKGGESDKTLFTGKKVGNVDKGGGSETLKTLIDRAAENLNKFSDIKITSNSSLEEIKKSYKSAAKNTHPDINGKFAGEGDTNFKTVNASYQFLDEFLSGQNARKYYRGDQANEQKTYETHQPTDVPARENKAETDITKTPKEAPAEAPKKNENVVKVLTSLGKDDIAKTKDVINDISVDDLRRVYDIFKEAETRADKEQKQIIYKHKKFIQDEINKRDNIIKEDVAETVLKGEKAIDKLPEKQREEAVKIVDKLAKAKHEVSPKAEKILNTIKENNKIVEKKLEKVTEEKRELLKKKSVETEPVKKKKVQEEIDRVDDERINLRKSKNKIDISNIKETNQLKKPYGGTDNASRHKNRSGELPSIVQVGKNKPAGTGEHAEINAGKGRNTDTNVNGKPRERYANGQRLKPIRIAGKNKIVVPTEKTIYRDNVRKGNIGGKPFTTNQFVVEFSDIKTGESEALKQSDKITLKNIIKSAEKSKNELSAPFGYTENGKNIVLVFKTGGKDLLLHPKFYNYLSKKYKNLRLLAGEPLDPIRIYDGSKFIGLVMPVRASEDEDIIPFKNAKPVPKKEAEFKETAENIVTKPQVTEIPKETPIEKVNKARAEKTLDKLENYGEGIGVKSRRDFIKDAVRRGWKAEVEKEKDEKKLEEAKKEKKEVSHRLFANRHSGQERAEMEKEIKRLEETIKNPPTKDVYVIKKSDNSFWEITKAEYDLAKELEKTPTKKYTKKEIEELAMSKDTFTEAEKNILSKYEGAGGQKEATGRGLLDEYYTPKIVIDKIWELIRNNLPINRNVETIIEPSVGTGRFIENAPKSAKIIGYETNPISAKISSILYPNARIENKPFEDIFVDKKGNKRNFEKGSVDIVIGNPPYGIHRGKYKGLGEEPKLSKYEEYFLKRSLDLAKEGGLVAMVIPSGFLRSKIDYAKEEIAKRGELVDAYRLPNGAFKTTDVGTDIVILEKSKNGDVNLISNNTFFENNPEKVLGIEGERRGRFGMEKYVEGNLEEAMDKLTVDNIAEEGQAIEEFVDNIPDIELEQPLTSEVKKEAVKKTMVAKKRKTKAQKRKKDMGVKGVFKRDTKEPQKILSVKKGTPTIFSQGKKLTDSEQRLYDLTQEDGTIDGADLTDEEKKKLNIIPSQAYTDKYATDFNYYQGDVYEKLNDIARFKQQGIIDDDHYNRQKKKLEELKPKKASIDKISILPIDKMAKEIKIGDKTLIDGFIEWLKTLPYNALEGSSTWEIAGYLNGSPVRGGNKQQNTEEKIRRRRVSNKLFKRYYRKELPEKYQKEIEDKFNKTFNGYIRPDYTKYPLQIKLHNKFYGKDFEVRPIQMEGAGFLVNKGVGLLAYEVGVGKTLTGIAAISEVMRKGWAKKPLIIVPKNLKTKWIRDIMESMPNAKINDLANLGKEFKYNGDRKNLTIDNGTISIITEEGFKRIGFKDETYKKLTEGLEDVTYTAGKKTKRSREIERAKREETIGLGMKKTDFPLTFEELGFDHITIDEAHRSKNIFSKAKTKGEKGKTSNEYGAVKGAVSERGLKTYLATQYILSKNKGRNVFLLTATPFNNSPIEIYSMLSLMAKNRLEDIGIKNINDFISLFTVMENRYAIKASGKIELTDQIREFNNLQQLQKLVREYIDFRTGEEANIPRPKKNKLTPFLKMNSLQADNVEKAQELFSPKFRKEGGVLKAIGELQKITLSPYLSSYSDRSVGSVSPREIVENSPKIKYAVEAIKRVHKSNPNAGQVIYFERGIELFRPIKRYFIDELGYNENEVGIIDSSASNEVKDEVKDKFQSGEIKILIASGTVKEGVDLQRLSTDLYNLYLQWNPTDMIQTEGRIWRQGSFYDNVRIHYPLVQNSVDPFIFQKLEEKASRIASVFSYKGDKLDVSDIDFEGMKFDLITDPVMRVEAKFEYEKAKIKDKIVITRADIAFIERRTKKIDILEGDVKTYKKYKEEAKKNDEVDDVKYYGDKLKEKQKRLKEEKEKIVRKGIKVDEIKEEVKV